MGRDCQYPTPFHSRIAPQTLAYRQHRPGRLQRLHRNLPIMPATPTELLALRIMKDLLNVVDQYYHERRSNSQVYAETMAAVLDDVESLEQTPDSNRSIFDLMVLVNQYSAAETGLIHKWWPATPDIGRSIVKITERLDDAFLDSSTRCYDDNSLPGDLWALLKCIYQDQRRRENALDIENYCKRTYRFLLEVHNMRTASMMVERALASRFPAELIMMVQEATWSAHDLPHSSQFGTVWRNAPKPELCRGGKCNYSFCPNQGEYRWTAHEADFAPPPVDGFYWYHVAGDSVPCYRQPCGKHHQWDRIR